MSFKLEPVIWARDNGQQIPCFDRCQLTITWMSNNKDVLPEKMHVASQFHIGIHRKVDGCTGTKTN